MYVRFKRVFNHGVQQFHGFRRTARRLAGTAVESVFIAAPLRKDLARLSAVMTEMHFAQIRRNFIPFNPIDPMHAELPLLEQDGSYHPDAWRQLADPELALAPTTPASDFDFELADETDYEAYAVMVDEDAGVVESMHAKKTAVALYELNPAEPKFYTHLDHAILNLTPAMMARDHKKVLALYRELVAYSQILTVYQSSLSQSLFERDIFLSNQTNIGALTPNQADNEPAIHMSKNMLHGHLGIISESDYQTTETSLRRLHSAQMAALNFLIERHPALHNEELFLGHLQQIDALLTEGIAAIDGQNYHAALACLNAITKARTLGNEWLQDLTLLLVNFYFDEETPIDEKPKLSLLKTRAERLDTQRKSIDRLVSQINLLRAELDETPREAKPRYPQNKQEPEVFQ